MTQYLKDSTSIPNWLMGIVAMVIVGLFTAGWTKLEGVRTEVAVEKTHRVYVVEKLTDIDTKIDKLIEKLDTKEDK